MSELNIQAQELNLMSQYSMITMKDKQVGWNINFVVMEHKKDIKGTDGLFDLANIVTFEPKNTIDETVETAELRALPLPTVLKSGFNNGSIVIGGVYRVTFLGKKKPQNGGREYNNYKVEVLGVPSELVSKLKAKAGSVIASEVEIDTSAPAPKKI